MFNTNGFAAPQLPVPYNQVDNSTFNGNLPNGNDAVPQINLSQAMMQQQQVALQAIGYFRAIAQSTVEKSPMHVFAYNLLSSNRFQNQVWQQWCQHLVTFTELLIMAKGYTTQDAIKMACTRLYEAFMGMAWKEYRQGLQQVVPNHLWNGLEAAANQLCPTILNDNQKYLQGGPAAFQQQQTAFSGNNNFNNGSGFQNNNNQGNLPRINQATVSGNFGTHVQNNNGMMLNNGSNQSTAGSGNIGGFYDEPEQSKPLQPVEEVSSDVYSQYPTEEYLPLNNNGGNNQMNSNFSEYTAATPEQEELPIPLSVAEVVIDPTYWQPTGYKLNMSGLYDHFFNPGGIEIRPAHKSEWELTLGDDVHYPYSVNPETHLMFHVRFPDGVVKEKAVEWTEQMNYMRHELDLELRRRAQRPNGIVVEAKVPLSTIGGTPVTHDEVIRIQEASDAPVVIKSPVILDNLFNGSTEMEVRESVVEAMEELLDTTFTAEYPMPAVEYVSLNTHYMKLSEEEVAKLKDMANCKDLALVALDLREMGETTLDVTYYRFLNQRLTASINRFMKENMSLTIEIDDFVTEMGELKDYIATKKGERYSTILQTGTQEILRKAITVETTDGGTCIVDYTVNFQLGWFLDQLQTLNIHSGKPVLISDATHPTILETLRGMLKRCGAENIYSRNLRLITADGSTLELIRGYLVPNAMLLKLVK